MTDHDDCRSKRRFATGAKANAAIDVVRRRGRRRSDRKPMRAYPCPHCKGWHLTSSLTGW